MNEAVHIQTLVHGSYGLAEQLGFDHGSRIKGCILERGQDRGMIGFGAGLAMDAPSGLRKGPDCRRIEYISFIVFIEAKRDGERVVIAPVDIIEDRRAIGEIRA